MKAVRMHQYGTVDDLKYEDVPAPTAGEGQVLVRLAATSVNPVDHKIASGAMKQFFTVPFPFTPGADFSGTVEAAGPRANAFKKGDEVFGWNPAMGSYAEMNVVPEALLIRKPVKLSHEEAASLGTVAQTAWIALLELGKIKAGQSVLIHSGAGGIGTFAVQFAHRAGAKVYTTASAENRDYLLSLGADEVIDYKKTPFDSVAKSMDLVIDTLGGETQARSMKIVKPGGMLISTVQPPDQEEATKLGITAMIMRTTGDPKRLQKIAEQVAGGEIKTAVSKTYPLSEVKEAWRQMLSGHTRGKIVLKI